MTAQTNKKNSSIKKRLVPATAMLVASAMALASSTYAWFTMSKEVEVTGIQMTATVPESFVVSLGDGQKAGKLVTDTATTLANATDIADPGDEDWSNSVRVSDYYRFGYLIPASSDTGLDIFYTQNAIDAGVAVTPDATFAQADTTLAAGMTSYETDKTKFAAWDMEYQTKGYYIDIPVWFKTSVKTDDVELKVKATIINGASQTSGAELYNAARVSILGSGSTVNSDTQGVLVDNTYDCSATGNYYDRYTFSSSTINQAVKAAGQLNGKPASGNTEEVAPVQATANGATVKGFGDLFGATTFITQAATISGGYSGNTVATVTKAGENDAWSTPVQYTIRVWLEGEDVHCWDPNAGQDFTIDLKFYRADTPDDVTAANKTA